MRSLTSPPSPNSQTWLSAWPKGRVIRLLIFVAIASALLPLFISDRMRGSQKQLVYYTEQNNPPMTADSTASAGTSQDLSPTSTTSSLTPPTRTSITATVSPKVTLKPRVVTPTRVAEFSDSDVLIALNNYRASHQIHSLVEESHLCQYAQSRVQDLVELGTLDGHAGFNADFADPLRLPQAIKDYPGSTIGEDLASQYCINMKTGQSFVATTPTALIEWCFDSSTKGHRESLLNDKFNNVCVRHGQNMYVVILGE